MNLQPNQLEPDTNPHDIIVLPSNGSTVTAEELKVRLVLAANFADGTYIDASGVDSVGQAVIQLLLAARIEACETQSPFEIQDPSPAFSARIEALGLGPALGLSAEPEASISAEAAPGSDEAADEDLEWFGLFETPNTDTDTASAEQVSAEDAATDTPEASDPADGTANDEAMDSTEVSAPAAEDETAQETTGVTQSEELQS